MLNQNDCTDIPETVYFLHHQYRSPGRAPRYTRKALGMYDSREAAEQAVVHYKTLPGFKEYPDGFRIDAFVVDQDYWTEGFFLAEVLVKIVQEPPAHTPAYARVNAVFSNHQICQLLEQKDPGPTLEYAIDDVVRCERQFIDGKEAWIAVERASFYQ